jgi:hypothetical protein
MTANVFLELNCTPPEDSNRGIKPEEGESVTHEDANALVQDEGGDSVAIATDINSASSLPHLSVDRLDELKILLEGDCELEILIQPTYTKSNMVVAK